MELIAPVIALVVLVLLARAVAWTWPRSSGLGGYRIWQRGESERERGLAEERGEANREDDDVRWRWRRRQTGS